MKGRLPIQLTTAMMIIAVVCLVGIGVWKSASSGLLVDEPPKFIPDVPQYSQSLRTIDSGFFISEEEANRAWFGASTDRRMIDGKVIAGIVNHHTLASDLIASFFINLRAARPELQRIVVVSPDHYKTGRDEVSTHSRSYQIGSRQMHIDEEAIRFLVEDGIATEENDRMFEREHGIGALVPFIARAYPDIRIVPIAFRGDLSKIRLARLSESLKKLWDEKTIIVISADMSHYLPAGQALKYDETTLAWLEARDENIAEATDDYIDSGKSVAGLFAAMNGLYPQAEFLQYAHAISSDYGGDPLYTTSYITGVWEASR